MFGFNVVEIVDFAASVALNSSISIAETVPSEEATLTRVEELLKLSIRRSQLSKRFALLVIAFT